MNCVKMCNTIHCHWVFIEPTTCRHVVCHGLAKVEPDNPSRLGASYLRVDLGIVEYVDYVALPQDGGASQMGPLIVIGLMWMWSEFQWWFYHDFIEENTDLRHKAPLLLCPKIEVQVGFLLNCVVVARPDIRRNSRNPYGYILLCVVVVHVDTCCMSLHHFASLSQF